MRAPIYFFVVLLFIVEVSGGTKEDYSKIEITEICFSAGKANAPAWIELKNLQNKDINLKGYKFKSHKKELFGFTEKYILKANGFMVFCFYSSKKASKDFKLIFPDNINHINIYDSTVLSEDTTVPDTSRYDISYMKQSEIDQAIVKKFDPDKETLVVNEAELYVYTANCIKKREKELFDFYDKITRQYCKNKKIPIQYKNILIAKLYYAPLYSGELALFDSNNVCIASILWGKQVLQEKAQNGKKKIKAPIDHIIVSRTGYNIAKSQYLGNVRRSGSFTKVLNFYNSSPGSAQTIKPFKDLKINIDINHDAMDSILKLDFFPFSFPLAKWEYEFEIASDAEFKSILYSKKGTPKSFLALNRLDFKLSKKQFEDFLWNPELYYRIRRILPDGYKTEWAGEECGKFLHKAYKDHIYQQKNYKTAMADKKLWDKVGILEEERRNLRKKNDDLRKSRKRTNNKEKIADLNKKIEGNLKQIKELSIEIKACYKKMRELKKKNRR